MSKGTQRANDATEPVMGKENGNDQNRRHRNAHEIKQPNTAQTRVESTYQGTEKMQSLSTDASKAFIQQQYIEIFDYQRKNHDFQSVAQDKVRAIIATRHYRDFLIKEARNVNERAERIKASMRIMDYIRTLNKLKGEAQTHFRSRRGKGALDRSTSTLRKRTGIYGEVHGSDGTKVQTMEFYRIRGS